MPERRALLVEDDATFRTLVRDALVQRGWRVDEAASALEADARLAARRYEVVVLDFGLPDRDGVACLERWRALGLETPVLGLTGAESDAVIEAMVLAGAHEVLDKRRFSLPKLLEAIDATGGPSGFPERDLPPLPRRAPAGPAPFPRRRHDGQRALIVDDTAVTRASVRRALEADGWRVEEAGDAAAALARDVGSFDLLVVDYLLPDVDGAALIEELREAGAHGAVLATTAHGSEEAALALVAAGADALLPKTGWDGERLRAAAEEACAARGPRWDDATRRIT
ncbi:MAG: two-component system, OmpR family, response regulator [Thermoplasmata archaeon]|jgi:DNA-binding response OmpR family regulator|nr:two-component system, OmpR family, response regulator [Thermoplasmata archaeon]